MEASSDEVDEIRCTMPRPGIPRRSAGLACLGGLTAASSKPQFQKSELLYRDEMLLWPHPRSSWENTILRGQK